MLRDRVRAFIRRHRAGTSAATTLVIGAVTLALDLDGVWGVAARPFGDSPWWGLLTLLPGCALVAVRDRAPVPALLAGGVLFVVDGVWFGTVGMLLVLHDLIYAATYRLDPPARRRLLVALIVVGAGVLALVAAATLDLRWVALAALLTFVMIGTPYWWATSVRQAEDLAALHAARAADAARLATLRQHEAVRAERARMARDLHDVIAGHLSAVALRSEAALDRDPDETRDREALAAIRAGSVRALEEMHAMILLLRSGEEPAAAADRLDRIPESLREVAAAVTLRTELGDLPPLPAAVDQAAARIIREAVLNAAKHAPGAEVVVRTESTGDAVRVEVTSVGGAPATAAGSGLGLVSLRERAEALGGTFEAGRRADGGWRVAASLPVQVPA